MKLLLIVAALLMPALASANPLTLTARTQGSTLDLTFKNISPAPLTFTTHVKAGLDHHDDLTVTLTGPKGTRTMQFWESRNKSIPIEQTIAPGGTLTRSVDLVVWSIRGENTGGPLEPGTYSVKLAWDATKREGGPKLKLAATTTLVLAAPKETRCKETAPTAKLALLGVQSGKTASATIGLHNPDTVPHCVHGIIRTHEIQNDWLTLVLEGDAKPRTIGFSGDRDKSYPVSYELAPGATLWTTWDLADWNKRAGAKPLPANTAIWVTATWDAKSAREVWRGTATTSFGMKLP